ncbi:MAG TPA: hypothetical protein VFJ28_12745 [Marmoricola sp.]|nr:hypothetical protein [Marmoricola sp.]
MAGSKPTERRRAGLFDIRVIIAGLLGVYGVILVLTGLLGTDNDVDNATNINLLGGGLMIVVSVAFFLWARIRPIVVPAEAEAGEERGASEA